MRFQYYANLFEANLYNDAELVFSDGSIQVSRMILCGDSKYFYDLFIKDTTKTNFEMKNINLAEFKVYYEYVHFGENFKIDGDKIVALLKIQVELKAPDLKIKLNEWIQNKDFITYLGIFFENTSNNELKEYNDLSKQLITTHFENLCEIKAFDSFSRDNFICLISEDFINDKDQCVILDIISRWVDYDFSNRKSDWLNFVMQIDYSKIEQSELNIYIQKNKNIFQIPTLIEFLYMKMIEKIESTNSNKNIIPDSIKNSQKVMRRFDSEYFFYENEMIPHFEKPTEYAIDEKPIEYGTRIRNNIILPPPPYCYIPKKN